MYAIQSIKTGKFFVRTDFRYRHPHQRTSNTKTLTYSSIAEAAQDFWVKRKVSALKTIRTKNFLKSRERIITGGFQYG